MVILTTVEVVVVLLALLTQWQRTDRRTATRLDRAADRKAWLSLYTHDVQAEPSPWGCTPEALGRLADAAKARGFDVVTAAEGARRLGL